MAASDGVSFTHTRRECGCSANARFLVRTPSVMRAWRRGAILAAVPCLFAIEGCQRAGDAARAPARAPIASPPPVMTTTPKDAMRQSNPPPPVDARFAAVDAVAEAAIAAAKMPGCVFVVGRHDEVVFERAYGARSLLPERTPMTTDTVFDLASLTKPIATATSVMLLADRGKLDLDARASRWVPELARLPPFTVRHLLLHTSGLPAGTPMSHWTRDRSEVLRRIAGLKLKDAPGEQFTYSDVGFVVLQIIVERVSGRSLAAFAEDEIFGPLGMRETGFLPRPELRERAAPTESRDGRFIQGDVHDPRAWALGGVAGHAGVFSTARDLTRFAQSFLQRTRLEDGRRLVAPKTFDAFLARRDTPKGGRAFGWDVDSTYATHRSALLSPTAFGHGGYTGTALWIDPEKDLFVLFLSNRVHPDGKGAVNPIVGELATLAVSALDARPGIDVLEGEGFARLRGATIGLVTNVAARARDGRTTLDVLRAAPDVRLAAIFTPEHGLGGDKEGAIADASYAGVPVHSLYGSRFTPQAESLSGIDTLVFDLQDVGVRFYTYAATMKRAMKVAAERKLRFVVLDRPNPLGGREASGPMLSESDVRGFVNHHELPVRHGMTIGELAGLFAADEHWLMPLEVVRVAGWRNREPFDRTNLLWYAPSPNLPTTTAVALYPAVGLLEATNVSVGRGTPLPFEIVAAPWLDAGKVIEKLDGAPGTEGLAFEATTVTPTSSVHAKRSCRAVRVRLVDRFRFDALRAGLALARALHEVHPHDWELDGVGKMLRHEPALEGIRAGRPLEDIEATWQPALAAFQEKRRAFLLYPEGTR